MARVPVELGTCEPRAWCRKQAAGIDPACEQVISECSPTTRSTGPARPRASSASPTSMTPAGSRPPARRRSPPATRPTHRQGHPRGGRRAGPAARRGRGRRRSCAARPRSRTSSLCPARSPVKRHPGDHGGSAVMTTACSGLALRVRDVRPLRSQDDSTPRSRRSAHPTGVSVTAITRASGGLSTADWALAGAVDQMQRGSRAARVG